MHVALRMFIMQVLASQLHFQANRNTELAILPLFWPVNCIKIGRHVALLSDPTVYPLYCVTNVLLDSWRPATQQQYAVYLKKWDLFCRARKIPSHSPTFNHVWEFLYTQLHLSHSSINTARSTLSCFLTINNHPVGKHPLVCRFLKGAFDRKPPPNRHNAIWDIKTVLAYLKTLSPNSSLSLKEISHKLVMLLALVSIQQKQTLVHLDINYNYMVKSDNPCLLSMGM